MSGYNISVDDRFTSKGLPNLKLRKRKNKPSSTPQDALSVSRGMVIKRKGLPESKYICVRKQYTKEEAQEELWGLQKHSGNRRWVIEPCGKCEGAWHILRLDW